MHKTPNLAQLSTPRRAQARPGAHSGRIVVLGPGVSQPGPTVSQPARPCCRPRSRAPACLARAPAPLPPSALAAQRPCRLRASLLSSRAPYALSRAPRAPVRACCAQLPSPSVAIQFFFLYCDTISQPNPAASVTIQKLYRDTLPSQPAIQSYNTTPPRLQYKLVYCNRKFSSPAFSIAIQCNPCNTIFP